MNNLIQVDIEDVMTHVHAEDEEKDFMQNNTLPQVYAYLNQYLASQGRTVAEMAQDPELTEIYKRCVLFIASTWYSNSEGSEPASLSYNSKIAGGLKALMEVMRIPNL